MGTLSCDARRNWKTSSLFFAYPQRDRETVTRTTKGSPSPWLWVQKVPVLSGRSSIYFADRSQAVNHYISSRETQKPRTNGLAERFIRTMKESLKNDRGTAPLQCKLDTLLLKYRNCPHATIGNSPAVLLIGRPLRCRLDLLKQDMTKRVTKEQNQVTGTQDTRVSSLLVIKYLQDPMEEETPGLLELTPNKLVLSLIKSKLAL